MVTKSIDLCGMQGAEAALAFMEHLRDPEAVKLCIGSMTLRSIRSISHFASDGLPVVEADIDDGRRFMFQFAPDGTNFRDTAVDADGRPICTCDPE